MGSFLKSAQEVFLRSLAPGTFCMLDALASTVAPAFVYSFYAFLWLYEFCGLATHTLLFHLFILLTVLAET